ncbi:MAG TPA: arginase family protein [Salinivirgaceae bacterium]|nr:arginase family protein [Salinivirgaceae bacterium]
MESIVSFLQEPKICLQNNDSPIIPFWKQKIIPKGTKIALIGIPDERFYRTSGKINYDTTEAIRKALSTLIFNQRKKIIDLGDLVPGESPRDTIFGLSELLLILLKNQLTPLIFGGGEELIYGIYEAIQYRKTQIKHTHIDFKIDKAIGTEISPDNIIQHISREFPYIHERHFLGTQAYYSPERDFSKDGHTLELKCRLGEIHQNLLDTEPIFRDSTFTTIDMDAVRSSDYPANNLQMPNGLYAEEICQLSWFSGISETSKVFGVFNYTNNNDPSGQGAILIAQILWHYIDGFYSRYHDPKPSIKTKENFILNHVCSSLLKSNLIFYKSQKTGRIWLLIENKRKKTTTFIPVSKTEYSSMVNDQIPEKIFFYILENQ